mmetsp:Transcript_16236/g.32557  ORF Transcript_16236/g.32557 Transcript_16236/m.32557 type:complete len:118 (-) Transcript_16236:41-394(-)|eukprot:CAMPEP_0196721816 /NCGR_PEP_ID=MMETSP1091-20130531/4293_1 /TAXON_ID=302021 /ORGANISM="Rhodomonas sp., Strain CCMP768" /LENGTH=117 /DNA_ID=CAMNT_0042063385 /DNA_START=46 /DNA_END=399 /DNA_ORIENTATION=-
MTLADVLRSSAASVQGVPKPAERRPQITIPNANEGIVISKMDALLIDALGKDSPAIPMGVFATGVILLSGLGAFNNNTSKARQQTFMRLRIGAQGVTVALMMGSLMVQERAKALGIQ